MNLYELPMACARMHIPPGVRPPKMLTILDVKWCNLGHFGRPFMGIYRVYSKAT